jgi:tRNA(Ile)-lysidine synthase
MPRLSPGEDRLNPAALFAPLAEFHRLGLAVSGGPDSLALMLLAHRFAAETGGHGRFVVYSIDHGLRPEAAAEAAYVAGEAQRLGFSARVLRWEGEKPATGIQEAARLARYRLFADAMDADGAEALLTAHHMQDQAETVLMRLAHGSGIEGLRGMDYWSEIGGLTVVRPLLGVDPAALRREVEAAGLTPVTDPSNSDIDYERVRWRQLMPQLAALGLDARRLTGFAGRMRDADRALLNMSSQAFAQVEMAADGTRAVIPRALLREIPRAIAVRVVGRALEKVGGAGKRHALAAVEALTERLIREPVRTTLHGCIVRSGRLSVNIAREPGRAAAVHRRRKQPSVS